MPINLDRAEQIGEENKTSAPKSNLLFCQMEVLTINKMPFNGVSFQGKDKFYKCPFCRKNAIKQILDYRCHNCQSKVIHWKCYVTKKEERHQQYDNYIAGFYEASEAKVKMIKEKYKKEGKEWSSGLESKITTLRPD
jgi:DNA-directed RNA polymerase subunit RPC12/RpoP